MHIKFPLINVRATIEFRTLSGFLSSNRDNSISFSFERHRRRERKVRSIIERGTKVASIFGGIQKKRIKKGENQSKSLHKRRAM